MLPKHFACKEYDDSFNDSFETLEKMCDKTASDPDSTLHKYLYGETKDGNVQDGASNMTDARNLALNLENLHIEQPKPFNNILAVDMTQLEDIEPPTRLFENTFLDTIEPEISPVKMVGLMRPSTIMEENNESESSRTSYHTAKKDSSAEVTNSSYNTAYDFCNLFKYNLPYKAKEAFAGTDAADNNELINASSDNTVASKNADVLKNHFNADDKNISERDLDGDDSIIDLVSDEEDAYDQGEIDEIIKSAISLKAIKQESESTEHSNSEIDVSKQSLSFDDTMEEVDYLINQYIAQTNANAANNAIKMKDFKKIDVAPKVKSPDKAFEENSPGPSKRLYKRGENKENRYALNMNMPKLDLFKNIKSPIKKCNDDYKNVASPVRTYIHKTSTAPLMTTFKPVSTTANINDAPCFKNLDFKSHNVGKMPTFDLKNLIPKVPRKLPKKAYISSDCKHFFDGRRKIKLPGGRKIHKFLDSATLPAVVRHEGKTEIPPDMLDALAKESKKEVQTQNDSSLVGLEVQAGEMSIYTIKDAQQFK